MYIPKNFAVTDFELVKQLISETVLANIIVVNNGEPEVYSVPLFWSEGLLENSTSNFGSLIGHIAKTNPLAQRVNQNWLVVFTNNGHYISPNCTVILPQNHSN